MGNQQSNERKRNWKAYKITRVDEYSNWVRCYLDDYVPYSDGVDKHMDFERLSTGSILMRFAGGLAGAELPRQAVLEEGWYIAIDIDWTRNFSSNNNFSAESVKTLGSSSSLLGEGGFQGLIGEIAEARELRVRANEWSDFDKQMQQAWQLQPPKK